ncbi:galactose oxidase [Serendipita vermifera]|nr:galactose oxidase [Serendipita vermifera]
MQKDWEEAHTVTEEIADGPPSRRANATLTPCPNGNHLWCIGGEFFSDDGKAYFYNDVYRYSPDKDEWRRFATPTCPGPRSAHAVVAAPMGGGKLFLFGGEFSSLYQNSFHHYRDFWVFDIQTHLWDRIETKIRPSGRSGHRMAMWKHYILLFGGFIDPGVRTNYLQDLWVFDTQEYKWQQVEFKENERRPSPRSGFSFLPVPEGAILHGGYCKEYVKGKRPQGIALDDTWLLKMDLDLKLVKWEKRKRVGYVPSVRSGCTMALWASKGIGVLFGGVYDDDKDEETLESIFYNDLYGYQTSGNGRWISLALKRPKKKGQPSKKKKATIAAPAVVEDNDAQKYEDEYEENEDDGLDGGVLKSPTSPVAPTIPPQAPSPTDEVDPDDPNLTVPLVRYNAMLAVLRNTLYIYGGIYERGAKEYTLDDFYSLQLEKLDRFVCLKESEVVPKEGGNDESEDEDESGEDGEDDDSDEESSEGEEGDDVEKEVEPTQEPAVKEEVEVEDEPYDIRLKAQAFLQQAQVSKPSTSTSDGQQDDPNASDAHVTPLPGETLSTFYARTKNHWAQKARNQHGSENRGKMLRRDGFGLAEERWEEYKPILEEVEKIMKEAGLEDGDGLIRKEGVGGLKSVTESRNRR